MRRRLLLRAPGGKTRSAKYLLPLLPDNFAEYREPCCYSAGMFWNIPWGIKRSLGDINPPVVEAYRRLRDDASFIDELMELGERATRDAVSLQREFARCTPRVKTDPLSFVFISQYAYFALVLPDVRKNTANLSSARVGGNWFEREHLEWLRAALKGVDIRCEDYGKALERPGEDVIIVLDPPYHGISDHVYDNHWKERDYYQLRERILDCHHNVLLTLGNDELCCRLFRSSEFTVIEHDYDGAMYNYAGGRQRPQHKHELIVLNYPLPEAVLA